MKSILFIFFLTIFLQISVAINEENYNTYSSLDIEFMLSSNISLNYDSNYKLQSLKANLSLVPSENYMQKVESLDINSVPNTNITSTKDSINYEWTELQDFYYFDIDAYIKTFNIIHKIPHIDFPIKNLDPEYSRYLEPAKIIDINQDIIAQTNSLVEGETDLFEAVFKIADWVKTNIKYDLNTLTATASQKSSWVLSTRGGVCDEITSLFISMLRASGIPARFITGMVYTNLNYDFGNHGWAEVYFPGYGWVPFDVTFGEYGWINPTHIKLSDTLDSAEPSIKYSWRAFNVNINPKELSLRAKISSVRPKINKIYEIKIEPLLDKVGASSYVPIMVTVENPFNHYVSTTLTIIKAPELLESNARQIILRPLEKKNFYWITKTPSSLDKKLIYTSQLEVGETFGSIATSTLEYSLDYNSIQLSEAKDKLSEFELQDENVYSKYITINCIPLKSYYYVNDFVNIRCNIKNIGNGKINSLNICLENNCKIIDLIIGEEKTLEFGFDIDNQNKKTYTINAKNNNININNFITLNIFDPEPLKISSISVPSLADYNDDVSLSFILSSNILIKDIDIKVNNFIPLKIQELKESKEVVIPLNSKNFVYENLKLIISYKDENNKPYKVEKEFNIKIENVPWYSKLINFFYNIFKYIYNL